MQKFLVLWIVQLYIYKKLLSISQCLGIPNIRSKEKPAKLEFLGLQKIMGVWENNIKPGCNQIKLNIRKTDNIDWMHDHHLNNLHEGPKKIDQNQPDLHVISKTKHFISSFKQKEVGRFHLKQTGQIWPDGPILSKKLLQARFKINAVEMLKFFFFFGLRRHEPGKEFSISTQTHCWHPQRHCFSWSTTNRLSYGAAIETK